VLIKRNTRVPLAEGLDPLPRWRAVWDDELLSNVAFAGVVAAVRRVPALVPPLARFSAQALGARSWTDAAHRVFVSRRRVRFLEMEYAVPRAAAPAVLAELRAAHEASDWREAFPVEVRLAAADDVPLSTASGRDTAYVAAHVPARAEPGPWFAALESIAGQVGGRPHWGKLHGLDAAVLRERYPRFTEFTALRDRLDPAGVLSNAYLDRVLGPAGG
jgi:L-gulonolactone oxidase